MPLRRRRTAFKLLRESWLVGRLPWQPIWRDDRIAASDASANHHSGDAALNAFDFYVNELRSAASDLIRAKAALAGDDSNSALALVEQAVGHLSRCGASGIVFKRLIADQEKSKLQTRPDTGRN